MTEGYAPRFYLYAEAVAEVERWHGRAIKLEAEIERLRAALMEISDAEYHTLTGKPHPLTPRSNSQSASHGKY